MASKREALIASAEKLLAKGKIDAALREYLKVLEETPGDINILNKVGDLFVRLNRNEESIPYFTRIAEHYSKDGFFLKAIAIYKKINKLDPARLEIYERLAELYARQGLGMEAKSQYQVLADYHAKTENVIAAIGIYQKMVATDPTNLQLHVKLADLYMQARRSPDALKEYGIVAAQLVQRGATGEAIQVYEKALRIAPDNVEILKTFVPLLKGVGRLADARALLRKAQEMTPRSVGLFLLASETAEAAGDLGEARALITKALAVEPENEEVLGVVLRIQQKAGRPDQAFPAASALAERFLKRGEAKKALALLAPVAEASKGNEAVLAKMVTIAEAAGDSAALLNYRSALAELLKGQGRKAEAAEALRACIEIAPDAAEYRARLAQIEPVPPPLSREAAGQEVPVPPLPPPKKPEAARKPDVEVRPEEMTVPELLKPQAAPPAAPTSGEFVLEFDDEQLVLEPGSTGPLPAPVRRLSEAGAPAFAPKPPAQKIPPPPAFGALAGLEGAGMPEPGLELAAHRPAALPPEALGGISWIAPKESAGDLVEAVEAEAIEAPELAEVPEPAGPVEPGPPEEVAEALEAAAAVEGFELPGRAAPAQPSAAVEEIEAPELAAAPPELPAEPTSDEIQTALGESEVFRKYGLFDKAVDQLNRLLGRSPGILPLREKLFEVYLEAGRKPLALKEADLLKEQYRKAGREDRVEALDARLVERTSAEMGEAAEPGVPPALVDTAPKAPREARAPRKAAPPAPKPAAVPSAPAPRAELPPAEELLELDFCLEQGMVVDASERLRSLEERFPSHPLREQRRRRLEGTAVPAEQAGPILQDVLPEDLESVLDAELGKALSEEMAKGVGEVPAGSVTPAQPPPALDESGLFSDEQEFFNFAGELQSELNQEEGAPAQPEMGVGQEVSLEEIFREFKKGVEQQLSPEDFETHYNLGIAYKEMSLTDEAIGEFQKAAKDPLHAGECCAMLGECFLEKGLPQLAIKWYRKGIETGGIKDDEKLGLQYELAKVYADVGDRDNAYKTFLEIYGSDANFRDVGERLKELAPLRGA